MPVYALIRCRWPVSRFLYINDGFIVYTEILIKTIEFFTTAKQIDRGVHSVGRCVVMEVIEGTWNGFVEFFMFRKLGDPIRWKTIICSFSAGKLFIITAISLKGSVKDVNRGKTVKRTSRLLIRKTQKCRLRIISLPNKFKLLKYVYHIIEYLMNSSEHRNVTT